MKLNESNISAPFFSVITVCFNAGTALLQAVSSALSQTERDFELIIQDGCSQDGSLSLLPDDTRIKAVSEGDDGIYDAMNRATSRASGRYLIFMNCGDRFKDETVLEDVKKRIQAYEEERKKTVHAPHEPPISVVYGDCILDGALRVQPAKITDFYLYRSPLTHQTVFFGRGVFTEYGGYDTSLKIRADHELTVRALRNGCDFLHIDRVICEYEGGGFSEAPENKAQRASDLEYIRSAHYSAEMRKKYDRRLRRRFTRLRNLIASQRSPKWLRRLYRRAANLFNR